MTAYDSPEAVYVDFLDTFNRRDAAGWAGVNAWPHARISAADPEETVHWRPATRIFHNAAEYTAAPIWDDLSASGWARSESAPPTIVQASDVKAHIAGGWTRFDADGRAIAANRIVYAAVRVDGSWRLQAQLKTDSYEAGVDFSAQAAAARAAVESALQLLDARDVDAYAANLAYPFTLVGPPGVVMQVDSAAEMAAAIRSVGDDQLDAPPGSAGVVNCGYSGANVIFSVQHGGQREQALALVGRREAQWQILAISGI